MRRQAFFGLWVEAEGGGRRGLRPPSASHARLPSATSQCHATFTSRMAARHHPDTFSQARSCSRSACIVRDVTIFPAHVKLRSRSARSIAHGLAAGLPGAPRHVADTQAGCPAHVWSRPIGDGPVG